MIHTMGTECILTQARPNLSTELRFVVEYGTDKDKKLDWHVDESEVTLNVCLGKRFTGGDLVFSGKYLSLPCTPDLETNHELQVFDVRYIDVIPRH